MVDFNNQDSFNTVIVCIGLGRCLKIQGFHNRRNQMVNENDQNFAQVKERELSRHMAKVFSTVSIGHMPNIYHPRCFQYATDL